MRHKDTRKLKRDHRKMCYIIIVQTVYGCMVWVNPMLDDEGEFLVKTLEAGDKGDKKKLPVEQRTPPENVREDDTGRQDEAIDYPDTDDDIPF